MALKRKLLADQTGTSAVEYGLICSLMVIGLVVGIQGLGASVAGSFESTANKVRLATLP